MKKTRVILLIVLLISIFFFSSCRSDGPDGVDITGVWSGHVGDSYYSDTIFYDFNSDGTVKMAGEAVSETGRDATLTWSLDDNYLEITDMFYMYSAKFAYIISADNQTMTLYMLAVNIMNLSYDDLVPGDVINLTKEATGTSILDLANEDSNF